MNQPCPRHGCPGVITEIHRAKGYRHCSAICCDLAVSREYLLNRLEKAETNPGYPARVQHLIQEVELLDTLEDAVNEYLRQLVRNIPRLYRASRELAGQEQAA